MTNTRAFCPKGTQYRLLEFGATDHTLESMDGQTRLKIARWVFNLTGWSLV